MAKGEGMTCGWVPNAAVKILFLFFPFNLTWQFVRIRSSYCITHSSTYYLLISTTLKHELSHRGVPQRSLVWQEKWKQNIAADSNQFILWLSEQFYLRVFRQKK